MVRLWLVKENTGTMWQELMVNNVYVEKGRKMIDTYARATIEKGLIIPHTIPEKDIHDLENGNTVPFLAKVCELLEYKNEYHINTIELYRHPEYSIQLMCITNFDHTCDIPLNYLATIINCENIQVYGRAVIYKIQNKHTVDLDPVDLLNLHINFYYVHGCKLVNNKFETIATNNYLPEVEKMFNSYKKRIIGPWIILSESQEQLDRVKDKGNDINELNGVIWFKCKEYYGDLANIVDSIKHNKASDYRGSFMDIDQSFVEKIFF